MLYNDLKLAFRHLWRRKVYTIIILSSLTIGFTCTTLLISFLISEIKTDTFHLNKDRTFQLFSNNPFGGEGSVGYMPPVVVDYITGNYPEVETICSVGIVENASLQAEAAAFGDLLLLSSDSSFFSVFTFPLKEGSVKHAFNSGSILLSEEKARLLFGKTDVLGKLISIRTADTTRMLAVSGVVANGAEKSHLKFDAIVHHSVLKNKWQGGAAYVLLGGTPQPDMLTRKINRDPQRPGLLGEGTMKYTLKPLRESYFNEDNRMSYMKTRSVLFIWVGSIVCGLIFFIASFNFINLFLLSLKERKKEAGIKKTLGASLKNLIRSSFAEVMVYVSTGFALSFILTSLLLTSFNSMVDASLNIKYLFRVEVIFIIGLTVFLLGIFAMIVSAFQQWNIRSVNLMKNISVNRLMFNRPFFLIQFVISVTLIICSMTIIRQMDFIEHEPLGFNRNLIQLQVPGEEPAARFHTLKQNLMHVSGINRVTVCSGNPISGNAIVRYDLENGEFYTPYLFSGDEDFVKTLDLTLLEGELPSPGSDGKLVNEAFLMFFNLHHPVGEKIPGTEDRIVGVVKDFTCVSFKTKIPPVIISYNENARRMLIGYSGNDAASVLSQIQRAWKKVFPDQLFSYQVIQQDLLNKYKEERFFYKVIVVSSLISMAISCFGLFALSWSVVQCRIKEIGIRKVLGATTNDILRLLTVSFIKRIFIAFIIAVPIGYSLMDKWLDNFVNKITLDVWIFVYSGCFVILISMLTVGVQTVKAAMLNPVDEIKTE